MAENVCTRARTMAGLAAPLFGVLLGAGMLGCPKPQPGASQAGGQAVVVPLPAGWPVAGVTLPPDAAPALLLPVEVPAGSAPVGTTGDYSAHGVMNDEPNLRVEVWRVGFATIESQATITARLDGQLAPLKFRKLVDIKDRTVYGSGDGVYFFSFEHQTVNGQPGYEFAVSRADPPIPPDLYNASPPLK